jgi:hypothetical protein
MRFLSARHLSKRLWQAARIPVFLYRLTLVSQPAAVPHERVR